jgi:hypothetical protein
MTESTDGKIGGMLKDADSNRSGSKDNGVNDKTNNSSASPRSQGKSSRGDQSVSRPRSSRKHLSSEGDDIESWPNPRKYNHRSLLLFSLKSPFRRALIAAIEWPWWDRIVLVVIMINSGLLAYYQPYDVPALRPNDTERKALEYVSKVNHSVALIFQ